MANLLYLVHRLPYPPNKGDKVRSFHLLKHLATKHRVFLGTFIDDPQDEVYRDALRPYCADLHIARLSPRVAKLRSLSGLLSNEALTLPYYRNSGLLTWVEETIQQQNIKASVIFSSAMAQYVRGYPQLSTLVDFVDVDSAKWTQYAPNHRWPMSWLYRREGERLLAFERLVAQRATHSFFVTENETELFCRSAPECKARVEAMCNGVDAEFFSPEHTMISPFAADERALVFTGAMDYWPNIDAVSWFAAEILPKLQKHRPELRFYIVGRSPTPAVQALANEQVVVTGTVDDVRPYLQHATVVVAPLRLARGIQNKVLEAMAMGLAVVASQECAGAVDAVPERDFLTAGTVEDYVRQIESLLQNPDYAKVMGKAARDRVVARYSWEAHLSGIDRYLDDPGKLI
ncbi:TIGR03087 family PEP-CTERM/XrtA system glycosyltransferase [Propionivibrio sp.]|uniref:TIGR03087 family PEP-CTERM/XrtA system glycosyltransferase n=2 Tax=Propionivibrio sp. TaxID=2212460 RepID=UPI0025E90D05|nr:TIGR03087 family PEP-CTERM/XrtA system glycosyltransferase [Propionivibrio sp.]MBK8745003.1 TIGR03087 family PEP-CTERM/XrtA system glycosyltransferase [Propionivibrio sp.]